MKSAYAAMYNVSGDPTWTSSTAGYTVFPWNHLGETNGRVVADPTSGKFTVTRPGIYSVQVSIAMNLGAANDSFNMKVFKNDVAYEPIQIQPNIDPDDGVWATGTAVGIIRCAAGDILDFRAISFTGDDTMNMASCSMTVVRLSQD